MYEQPLLCIDGVWREGRAGRTLPMLNPADESLLADTPAGGVKASGIGYEGGDEGLAAYRYKKLMSIPI